MLTISFGHSIKRNQHCINLRSQLGLVASFVLNQLQKFNISKSELCKFHQACFIVSGYGTSSGAPSPAVAAAPGANWGGYTGSELDFPSPASMGGMATIPTTAYSAATAANGGRYPGVTNENSGRFPNDLSAAPSPYQPHDYYSHQNYAGLNAQSASSHSPTGIERSFQFIFSTLTQIVEQLRGLLRIIELDK